MQTVYRHHIPGDFFMDPLDLLYITKGDAIENCNSYREVRRILDTLTEEQVQYDGDLAELAKTTDTLFKYVQQNPYSFTTWHTSQEAAAEQAKKFGFNMNEAYVIRGDLYQRKTFPITVPFEATLNSNSRGLYCEIDMHPEESGGWKKKFYFPDRSCKDKLVPGRVVVTKVIDRGSYGFIIATMKQYSRPDEATLAETFVKDDTYWNYGTLEFLDTPHGKLTLVTNNIPNPHMNKLDHQECWVAIQDGNDFKRAYSLTNLVLDELSSGVSTVEETITIAEFLCQGYQGCTLAELRQKFIDIPFDGNGSYRTTKYRTDPYNDAVKCGIFMDRKFANDIEYIEVDESCMLRLATNFTKEEVEGLVKLVNGINERATTIMKKRIRSGKYKLT